jgi:hypothetical protein
MVLYLYNHNKKKNEKIYSHHATVLSTALVSAQKKKNKRFKTVTTELGKPETLKYLKWRIILKYI